jgi:4-amino-4-deoxy-L-arabinose transferase-like glycosyltransferase
MQPVVDRRGALSLAIVGRTLVTQRLLFWAAIIVGMVLRFVSLGHIPAGLNGDEAEEGVEAISLLATSMDRWGHHFPVFFSGAGMGVNPLYTYLTLPIFWLFGPSVFNLRILAAVLGVLTLPVTYIAGKAVYGREVGLGAMLIVAVIPWHVMTSRWGVEWSITPFFFTLGLYTIASALRSDTSNYFKLIAFVPWAIGSYSYFVTVVPMATIAVLTLITFRATILPKWRWWLAGLTIAAVLEIPAGLFTAVNTLKWSIPFEASLPFAIPHLPASRLSQISDRTVVVITKNLAFFLNGYRDNLIWNEPGYFLPLTAAAPLLLILAVSSRVSSALRARGPDFILLVVFAVVVPICAFRLNVNRINWFYIPSIIISVKFVRDLFGAIDDSRVRQYCAVGGIAFLGACSLLFYENYFSQYNKEILAEDKNLGNGFRVGLNEALGNAVRSAEPSEPIFVDAGSTHQYLYVLFYGYADPKSFQTTRKLSLDADKLYHVASFDRFFFDRPALPPERSFAFVSLPDKLPCDHPQIFSAGPLWSVGRCGG